MGAPKGDKPGGAGRVEEQLSARRHWLAAASVALLAVLYLGLSSRLRGSPSDAKEPCEILARRLSAAYSRDAAPYSPASDGTLERWMSENGVLVHGCFPRVQPPSPFGPWRARAVCDNDMTMDHISASWTGHGHWFVYPTGVGKIIDPMRAKVSCVYPLDAASDARDGKGCGPVDMDPSFGSNGRMRLQNRWQPAIDWFLRMLVSMVPYARGTFTPFLPERNLDKEVFLRWHLKRAAAAKGAAGRVSWLDVNCTDLPLFSMPREAVALVPRPEAAAAGLASHCDQVTSRSRESFARDHVLVPLMTWRQAMWQEAVGHPICADDSVKCEGEVKEAYCHGERGNWQYDGPCWWPPERFSESEDAKWATWERSGGVLEKELGGSEKYLWNEVVLDKKQGAPAVAAYYTEQSFVMAGPQGGGAGGTGGMEITREAAHWYAKHTLGGVPVLKVDLSDKAVEAKTTFTCDLMCDRPGALREWGDKMLDKVFEWWLAFAGNPLSI